MDVKPFADVRILDFTRYLAGPFGTYQLALLGADVVKIEPPEGDQSRVTTVDRAAMERKMAPTFVAVNGNKRSITLNLRSKEAIEVIKSMVREVDVVWENFRPGIMNQMGLGYEVLSAINPKLIYCAVSGFGQTGPARNATALDGKIQAMSGIMSLTGDESGGPMRAGFPVCDVVAGMTAAFAVASSLYQRARTGRGQLVDVSMLDATLTLLGGQIAEYTMTGMKHKQFGNLSVTRKVTANRFRAGGGYIVLAVLSERQFTNLMTAIGRADALEDPRFVDWFSRRANEPALRAIIEQAMEKHDPEWWEAHLASFDVTCAAVKTIDEVVSHEQLAYRRVLQRISDGDRELTLVGSGFELEHGSGSIERATVPLGHDTEDVLREFGYDTQAIASLRSSGALG